MAFKAKFKVAGKEFTVLHCSYDLNQEVDPTGRPSSVTRGGRINVTVESNGETGFFEWMTNNFERKDGSIVFVKRDTDATLKEVKFKEGYLIKYKENFDATGQNPLTESFTISAKELASGGGEHVNEWV